MTRPKNTSRYPVSSFGPEIMALLTKGTREEVRVACTDRKQMRMLQQRIHMLRGAMAREKHPQYAIVTRARTSQSWKIGDDGKPYDWALYIRPQDSQFAAIIKSAGVDVTPTDGEVLLDSVLPPEPSNETTLVQDTPPVIPENPYEKFK